MQEPYILTIITIIILEYKLLSRHQLMEHQNVATIILSISCSVEYASLLYMSNLEKVSLNTLTTAALVYQSLLVNSRH